MRIAKPPLLITTPIGVIWGLYEGYRLAGGLVFLMAALIGLMCVALGSVVLTIRRERDAERKASAQSSHTNAPDSSPQ